MPSHARRSVRLFQKKKIQLFTLTGREEGESCVRKQSFSTLKLNFDLFDIHQLKLKTQTTKIFCSCLGMFMASPKILLNPQIFRFLFQKVCHVGKQLFY